MITTNDTNPLLAGVIGNPISHSKSPKLHNYWLNKYGINGYYIPLAVHSDKLKVTIESLVTLGFRGINVTMPYKTSVLSFADTITDRASVIGAANTLYFSSSGKVTADNTDGYGFTKNVYHHFENWDPKAGEAVVFGAGGAAKAIVYALLAEGVPKVKILNRTKVKAELIADHFGNKVEVFDWYSYGEALHGAKTIVNTTSLGMVNQPQFRPNFETVSSNALVTDLVYNPLETDFLLMAKQSGCQTVDGLGMLLFQAELGFSNWFNLKPEINNELKSYMLNEND
jgi:shikimate dehydrogenase